LTLQARFFKLQKKLEIFFIQFSEFRIKEKSKEHKKANECKVVDVSSQKIL